MSSYYPVWFYIRFQRGLDPGKVLDLDDAYTTFFRRVFPDQAFFDEAQDASAVEFELLKEWASHAEEVYIFGDDLQAIYEWRGGTVEGFLEFSDDIRVLEKSWRLPSEIVKFARKIEGRVAVKHERIFEPREQGGVVLRHAGGFRDVTWLNHIEGETMIMATTNRMVSRIVQVLKEKLIPFHNPWRVTNGQWNPLGRREGAVMPVDRIEAYVNPPWSWADLYMWAEPLNCIVRGKKKLLKQRKGDAKNMVPVDDLKDIIEDFAWQDIMSLSPMNWIKHLGNRVRTQSIIYAAKLYEAGRQNMDRVIVGTVHSLKGSEADTVIIFPDLSINSSPVADDSARVMYVGCTRARAKLVLCSPSTMNYWIWPT